MSDYLALKGLSDRTEAGAEQDNINVVHKPINQPEPLYIAVEWMKPDNLGKRRGREAESLYVQPQQERGTSLPPSLL